MEIKISPQDIINIFANEIDAIEKYTGKTKEEITDNDYYNYLVEKHPNKVELEEKVYERIKNKKM